MSGTYTGAGKLRPVQPGDPVASQIVDQPILVLARRIEALEALIQQQEATTAEALIINNVSTDGNVAINDVVYYNPSTGLFGQAIAAVTLINNTFTANPTALPVGVAVSVSGTTADIQVGGIGTWTSSSQAPGMMQAGETFQAGAPYYLSATQAGKLTRFPPMMRVQVLLTTATNFVVSVLPSIPEAIENNYTVPIGMRPVGSLRALGPDYTKNIIVGFDALENTGTAWQITSQNANTTLQQFGYMVADAALTALPAAPHIYVEIDVDTGGVITAFSSATLLNLVAGGPSVFNTQVLSTLTSGNFTQVRGYSLVDQNGMALGVLSFKFTTADVTCARKIVFKIPDSFQGWKMICAPVNPIAVPVLSGTAIASITMQERGVGFATPPAVVVSGGGGTGAVLTAILDVYGSVTSVTVVNGGTGYTALPTITFDTNLASIAVVGGGDGAAVSLTVAGGVITAATVTSPGSNYGSAPSLVVMDAGSGTGAILQPTMQNGTLLSVAVLAGGAGYTSSMSPVSPTVQVVPSSLGYTAAPDLIITSGNPLSAGTTTTTLTAQRIQSIQIVCGGINYAASSTILLTDSGTGTPSPSAEVLAYTDANGSIYQVKIMTQGGYASTPTLSVPTPGSGYGAQFIVSMASAIASVAVVTPGSGYQSVPEFQFGATLASINITQPGSLYQPGLLPTVTLSAPDDNVNGIQATATAKLGGYVSRVNVISGGSGYTSPGSVTVTVTRSVLSPPGTDATFTPIFQGGILIAVEIITPGDSYTVAPTLTLNNHTTPGSGAVIGCELEALSGVVSIALSNVGKGYITPPSVSLTAPVDSSGNPIVGGYAAQARVVLASGPAAAQVTLNGMGGSRMVQVAVAAQGNNLQIFDFHDDLDSPGNPFPTPQSSSILYYNIKADPLMTLRYPPNPIEKVQAVCNGVELLTRPYNTATGAYTDPDTDVGISTETPFWTTFDLDGSPWDRNWVQYWRELAVAGSDAIIQNTGPVGYQDFWFRLWENVFKYAPCRNKGWLHINKASQFYQTNKITSLGVLSPLRLIDVASGVESANDGSPMTGQLCLTIDAQDNFIGGTGVEIDMTLAGQAQAIYTNNTGVPVGVSSVIMLVVFQSVSTSAVSAMNNTAQITIGTAAGGYRDYVGTTSATVANTWLSQTNQFKEFFPDPGVGSPLIPAGQSLFVNVMQPAGAPITAQLTVCKVKGFVV